MSGRRSDGGTNPTVRPPAGDAWRRDLRGAAVLARTELRATRRRLTGNRRRLAATATGALHFAVIVPALAFPVVAAVGRDIAAGDPPLGVVGAAAGGIASLGLFVGLSGSITQERIGAVGPLVLTSLPPRAVAVGRIASELVAAGGLAGPPILALLVVVGVGAGGPVVPLLLTVGTVPLLLASALAGRTAGSLLRYTGVLSRLSAWTKVAAFVALASAFFVGTQVLLGSAFADGPPGSSIPVSALVPGRPMQAYAEVVLAPAGGRVTPAGLAAVGVVLVATPAGLAAAAGLETRILVRGDGRSRSGDATGGMRVVDQSRTAPAPFAARPTTRMCWRQLLRTARDPKSLAHLFPLLFGLLGAGVSVATDPESLSTVGPPAAVTLGAVLAGVTFCLNPMGDDREQLPLILTSARSTAVVLRGRAVAGAVVGLAVAVGVGTPLALLGNSPVVAVGQTVIAPVLVAASAGIALGLGALVPEFERREYVTVERAHPSQFALLGYVFVGTLLFSVGPALFQFLDRGWLTVAPRVLVAALVAYLALLSVLGVGGYVYAVRRFDALTLDDV